MSLSFMDTELTKQVSMFEIYTHKEEALDAPAGFCLPDFIDEQTILDHWINPNRALLQYNDVDYEILDYRNNSESSTSSPVEKMTFIPDVFAMSSSLFQSFCSYFGVPLHHLNQLHCVIPQQSVALVRNSAVNCMMAFPFFKNVNYYHYDITPMTSLRTLMGYQDQAIQLNVEKYPFIYDIYNTGKDYLNMVVSTNAPTPKETKKRTFEMIIEEDEEDSDDMQLDEDDETVTIVQKQIRLEDWSSPTSSTVYDRIINSIY